MARRAKQRARQPQQATAVNWGNPLAQDLHALFNVAAGPRDLVYNRGFTTFGAPTRQVGGEGVGLVGVAGASGSWFHAPDVAAGSASALAYDKVAPPLTIFGVGWAISNASHGFIIRGNGSGLPAFAVGAHTGSFRGGKAIVRTTGGSLALDPASAVFDTAFPAQVVSVLVIGETTTTLYSGYRGRILHTVSGATPTGNFFYEHADVYRVLSVGGSNTPAAGVITAGQAWRAWSETHVREYFRNPWQLFKPPQRRQRPPPTTPTLSLPTAFNITATTVTPRVTVTF